MKKKHPRRFARADARGLNMAIAQHQLVVECHGLSNAETTESWAQFIQDSRAAMRQKSMTKHDLAEIVRRVRNEVYGNRG
jgi:hypothetical protein